MHLELKTAIDLPASSLLQTQITIVELSSQNNEASCDSQAPERGGIKPKTSVKRFEFQSSLLYLLN